MDDIYREVILDHYKNPRNFGNLENPSVSYRLYNSACGDEITIDIIIKNKEQRTENRIIENIKFRGEGCAISMASASMLTEAVKGKKLEEVKRMETADILKMLGITLTPTRLKCALLPLEVFHKTLVLAKNK